MQRDAVRRLGLRRLLLEPEMLQAVEPDIHLVGTLLSLRGAPDARQPHATDFFHRYGRKARARRGPRSGQGRTLGLALASWHGLREQNYSYKMTH
jgi:hypothetical protein